ncbi:hypothetical protein CXB51_011712 [Gossypium anomalum]|uniref:DUF7745 domain-containing protein n=1 Tax=Gossypium anomalum TaxID=47600 RepID=A0A8J5Z3S5_9ROSI|nr:hypothetical protein CXB51_011712 [Gossypium anomalum]
MATRLHLLSGSEKLPLREVFTSAWDSGSLSGYICTYVFVRFSSPCSHREIELSMENESLDKVEDSAAVRIWFKKMRLEKYDSLIERYVSELWDFTRIDPFYCNYDELPYLFDIKVDKHLFRALAQIWNSAYSCFTFGKVDLVPRVEEYTALFQYSRIQANKAYSRAANILIFLKKLMSITRMNERKEKVNIFALSIYGLVIFFKALGYKDEAVSGLLDRLDKMVTPVSTILAETFRSLNTC